MGPTQSIAGSPGNVGFGDDDPPPDGDNDLEGSTPTAGYD